MEGQDRAQSLPVTPRRRESAGLWKRQFRPVPSHPGAPRRVQRAGQASGRVASEFQQPESRTLGPGMNQVSKLERARGKNVSP